MCRFVAYLGEPRSVGHVLYETDSCLVKQSYSPRMMASACACSPGSKSASGGTGTPVAIGRS